MYDFRPSWAKRGGFMGQTFGSITAEINAQIAQLRKRGESPALVRLCPRASVVYAWEHWARDGRVSDAPTKHKGYRCSVPMRYRDAGIVGVVVTAVTRQRTKHTEGMS